VTPEKISVVPESRYIGKRNLDWVKSQLPSNYSQRAGWYLQQFIKIESCRQCSSSDICLIWDADTIPLNELNFIDENGLLIYYKGADRPLIHEPYFGLINKVLNLSRIVDGSFISQSFPVRSSWVQSMCSEIETKFDKNSWIDVILGNIDHSKGISGFSEYETLGTYISNHYPNAYKFSEKNFYRHGTALMNDAKNLDQEYWRDLKNSVDYIAFEEYESSHVKGLNIGCGNSRIEKTFKGNLFLNVDLEKYAEVDLIVDVTKQWPFPNSSFEHIVANNILEHVDDIMYVMSEIDRCLEPGGIIKIEVPFIGSYNHGTDITHKRGLTFNSFNFLFADGRNYLYRDSKLQKYNYKLINFQRENIINGQLVNEFSETIPLLGEYGDWIDKVRRFEIPGTFGFIFQKIS
jgi:SAM-dependent methyltransferase